MSRSIPRGIYSETFNIVVMRPYLEKNGPLVEKFLAALIDAEAWTEGETRRRDHDRRRGRWA